jgi:hypothetical protein
LKLVYSIAEFRSVARFAPDQAATPASVQPQRDENPERRRRTVNLFHKNDTSSTVISYTLDLAGGAVVQLSTPQRRRSVGIDPFEEHDFLAYLHYAHQRFIELGVR